MNASVTSVGQVCYRSAALGQMSLCSNRAESTNQPLNCEYLISAAEGDLNPLKIKGELKVTQATFAYRE